MSIWLLCLSSNFNQTGPLSGAAERPPLLIVWTKDFAKENLNLIAG